jgi:hypothetical protein
VPQQVGLGFISVIDNTRIEGYDEPILVLGFLEKQE